MSGQKEPIEDGTLIAKAQQGEREAFDLLVRRYQERLYRASFALVGNTEDAMDVTQEAFFRAFQAIGRFEIGREFFPWIYKISRNLGLSRLQRKKRSGFRISLECPCDTQDKRPLELADPLQDPRQKIADQELEHLLSEALEALKTEDREILLLKDFQNHSYQEISELLDIPIGTVMSRLYYARERLRKKMEKYLEIT